MDNEAREKRREMAREMRNYKIQSNMTQVQKETQQLIEKTHRDLKRRKLVLSPKNRYGSPNPEDRKPRGGQSSDFSQLNEGRWVWDETQKSKLRILS